MVTGLLTVRAATPNVLDPTFPNVNFNNTVSCVIQDHNGKLLVSGLYTMIGGSFPSHIARFNADGTLDSTFADVDINGPVYAMAEDANGKILVAGLFNTVNGTTLNPVTLNRVARFNADGTLDPTFGDAQVFANVVGILVSSVSAIAVDSSGRIVIAGAFNTVTGLARNYLARLNADGTLDTTFADPALDGVATTVAIDPIGRVLVGGQFTSAGGSTRHLLARFNVDGTLDPTFADPALSGGGGNGVEAVIVDGSGRIVVAGDFTSAGGSTRHNLARFNPDGTLDPSLADANLNNFAGAVRVDSHGKIVVAGSFTTASATNAARNGLARFNRDGTLDATFADPSLNASASTLAIDANGKLLVGGSFTSAGGLTRNRLARFNGEPGIDSTRADPTFTADGALNFASAVAMGPDGKILMAGGSFVAAHAHDVERVNPDGSLDFTFTDPNLDSGVRGMAVDGNGKILIVGDFSSVGGLTRTGVARLNANGTVDASFDAADSNYFRTYCVALDGNGKILVGSQLYGVRRLNVDGSNDATFTSPNLDDLPFAIAPDGNGKILIGGHFQTAGGTSATREHLARFNADGTLDTTFADPNLNGDVTAILVDHSGKILVGGDFTTAGAGNATRSRVARFNADGTLDSTFGDVNLNGSVRTLREDGNGQILVGGGFSSAGGRTQRGLARFNTDGTLDAGFSDPEFDDEVYGLAIDGNGKLVVGGHFTEGGSGSSHQGSLWVIRLQAAPPTVTSISPATGPAAGGTSVTITGTGFTGASTVFFGTTFAASFTINSDTSITAVSPAGAAGAPVDVTVVNAVGASTTSVADEFIYFGAATHLGVSAPGTATAGVAISATVTALDSFNHTVVDYAGTVKITSSDVAATLPGDSTLTSGVGTFSVTLNTTGNRTITATDTVTSSITGTSATVTVSADAVTHFTVSTPSAATAGAAMNFTVVARDAGNNTVTSYAGTVHFTSTDGAATVPANTTLTNGLGSFSATLRTAGNSTLTATDTVTPSITGTSGTIGVNPAVATHLIVSAPGAATASAAFNATVTALDAFNNTATGYAGTVHFTSSDGLATLPGNSTLLNGVGTFLVTLKTTGNQTITATDTVTGSITGTSGTVAVSVGAATHFSVAAPASATAGSAISVTVTALDAGNNPVTGYAGTVHFTSSDGAAVLAANSTLTNGVGTFSTTLKTAGTQTITATDAVSASITGTTGSITVNPGAATYFTVSTPGAATAGTAVNVTVTVLDASNNTATGYAGTVHFTSTDGAATLPANATLTAGTKIFSVTFNTTGNCTLTATDTVTSSITGTSAAVTVSAGAATHFSVSAPASATPGVAFSVTVTAKDASNNTATGYAGTVHFASTDGAATLPANSTLTSGTGTFSATLRTTGSVTLTATDSVVSSITGTSAGVTVGTLGATVTLGNLAQTYDGTPKSATATTMPAALTVNFTYDGSAIAPTNAGSYAVVGSVSDVTYSGSANGTLTIAPASQTIAFAAIGSPAVGAPVALSATASSGLPVTFSVVSGNATVNGSTLTLHDGNGATVRAAQTGNANYSSATSDQTISASAKLAQTITFIAPPDSSNDDSPFDLIATASSGLPVTFTIVSGPAMLDGHTVTLTGAGGVIVVRASQPGDATYAAAADVLRTFNVAAATARVFFGDFMSGAITNAPGESAWSAIKAGDVAAVLGARSNDGALLIVAPAAGVNALVPFTLQSDGSYVATATQTEAGGAAHTLTLHGHLANNVLSGSFDGSGLSFDAPVERSDGPTATVSGRYRASALVAAVGQVHAIVGTNNNVLALFSTPTLNAGGPAVLRGDLTFTVTGAGNVTILGAIDPITTTVTGTIVTPGAPDVAFAGLKTTTLRTDRLVNLSSRARVGAGEKLLITGFVVVGPQPKQVLVRAVGPGLSALGVTGALADPHIRLFHDGVVVGENENWGDAVNAAAVDASSARVGAFALTTGSKDAALLVTLAPGVYSTLVTGTGGSEGIALAEVYDASENPEADYQRLANISSRGYVSDGDNILIAGFVVVGNSPKKILVRGVGPALGSQGVGTPLADPLLRVLAGPTRIAENDNWDADAAAAPAVAAGAAATGAFVLPAGGKDAAMVLTLAPGLYSVQVVAAPGTAAGVALVEVYEIPE